MNAITENQRGLRVFCNFLPKETLFGFKTLFYSLFHRQYH